MREAARARGAASGMVRIKTAARSGAGKARIATVLAAAFTLALVGCARPSSSASSFTPGPYASRVPSGDAPSRPPARRGSARRSTSTDRAASADAASSSQTAASRPRSRRPPPTPPLRSAARRAPKPPRGCSPDAYRDVIAQVNAVRAASGLPPLRHDARLGRAASARAATLARTGRLSHAGWEQEVRSAGCDARRLGENVASGYGTPRSVVQGWLDSRAHRANILNPRFHSIGVGCVADRNGMLWWAQDFAG